MKKDELFNSSSELYALTCLIIWRLVYYYSALLGVDAGEAFWQYPGTIHQTDEGFSFISFTYPRVIDTPFSEREIEDILKEYLLFKLLPESSIQPFIVQRVGNDMAYEVIEALGIYHVELSASSLKIDVFLVDSVKAYNYYIKKEETT